MAYRNDPEVAHYQSCDSLAVPAANTTGVASGVDVTATISEAMMTNSINGTTFKLSKAGRTTAITDLGVCAKSRSCYCYVRDSGDRPTLVLG